MNQMASIKQIEANRSNALNGKGPRTAEGKARSSRNALTHGLTAQEIVIPGEDVAAYVAAKRSTRSSSHDPVLCAAQGPKNRFIPCLIRQRHRQNRALSGTDFQ